MRRAIKISIFAALSILFSISASTVSAKLFEESYVYDAGEADSKLSCRAISLLEVKRLLLEKIGTYIESRSEVKDFQLSRDEIISLTAGIVKTEIIAENWDGKTYQLTAKIEADPEAVTRAIDDLRKNQQHRDDLANVGNVNEKTLERIEELKVEMAGMQKNLIDVNRDYEKSNKLVSAWDLSEKGLALVRQNNFQPGIEAFTEAIKLNPNYNFYYHRGRAYLSLEQYTEAVTDFNQVIALSPDMKDAYFRRGRALIRLGEKRKGLDDIRKAAALGQGNAKRWLEEKGKF
ncbi:MAG: tetratricopeptide repeat protein [Proteobacteria bacterium]|nr:tetratricopeptide repeat protein [Pseudomonadota bacterium]